MILDYTLNCDDPQKRLGQDAFCSVEACQAGVYKKGNIMNIYRWLRQHPIAVYLILANVFTWIGWFPTLIIRSQQDYPLPVIGNFREWLQTGFPNPNKASSCGRPASPTHAPSPR
jgi:hypothetical protein